MIPTNTVHKMCSWGSTVDVHMNHFSFTEEHTYDACPKYSELGNFRILAYLYVSDGSCRWQRQSTEKRRSVFHLQTDQILWYLVSQDIPKP